jgi:hypothetical protein
MKDITHKMLLMISALLRGMTLEEAAQEVGCSYRTARRWKATPEFQRALRTARTKVLEEIANLYLAMGKRAAVVVYEAMADNVPMPVRLRAAAEVRDANAEFTGMATIRAELDEMWSAVRGNNDAKLFARTGGTQNGHK